MKYYIYNLKTNRTVVVYDKENLIGWFGRFNSSDLCGRRFNIALQNINMTFKDTKRVINRGENYGEVSYELREFLVYNELKQTIDPRRFEKEILNYKYVSRLWPYRNKKYEFRKEPVPYIGNKYRGKHYRNPKTTQEIRFNCDNEHKEYIRGKRSTKSLPTSYSDLMFSNRSISWKDQSKSRKQWTKNLK